MPLRVVTPVSGAVCVTAPVAPAAVEDAASRVNVPMPVKANAPPIAIPPAEMAGVPPPGRVTAPITRLFEIDPGHREQRQAGAGGAQSDRAAGGRRCQLDGVGKLQRSVVDERIGLQRKYVPVVAFACTTPVAAIVMLMARSRRGRPDR